MANFTELLGKIANTAEQVATVAVVAGDYSSAIAAQRQQQPYSAATPAPSTRARLTATAIETGAASIGVSRTVSKTWLWIGGAVVVVVIVYMIWKKKAG